MDTFHKQLLCLDRTPWQHVILIGLSQFLSGQSDERQVDTVPIFGCHEPLIDLVNFFDHTFQPRPLQTSQQREPSPDRQDNLGLNPLPNPKCTHGILDRGRDIAGIKLLDVVDLLP